LKLRTNKGNRISGLIRKIKSPEKGIKKFRPREKIEAPE